ncbi:MAG: DUF1016 domain-containing protein, partial [Verrucomicrobia bacterium]|nr:DUF1016 domain-containing protein [Verrucomicrobiota bacterium]
MWARRLVARGMHPAQQKVRSAVQHYAARGTISRAPTRRENITNRRLPPCRATAPHSLRLSGRGGPASGPRLPAMPRLLPAPSRSFDGLVRAVREALIQGQAAADRAHLLSYHRTGHYIAAHLLAHRERADFGAHVVRKLAAALPADLRLLYRCLRFYRAFPIVADRPQLAWAHYRVLIDVADKAQRDALVREALEKNWTSPELEQRVRLLNAIDVTPPPAAAGTQPRLLKPRRGTPGVCRVIEVAGVPALDLGFACYRDLPARSPLAPGDFARVTAGDLARVDDATKADLYTYRATILRVVDGDTLWVRVD